MMRRVAVQIPPSPTDGGVGIVHAVLQHWLGSGGACVDRLVGRFGRNLLFFELLLRYTAIIGGAATPFVREAWACGDRGPV